MNVQTRNQIVATCFVTALAALLGTRRADAGVIYDNLALPSDHWVYGETNDLLTQPFVLDSGTTVASATLRLVRYHTSVSGTLSVQIWDDNGSGMPGSPVGTLGTTAADLGLGNWDYYVPAYLRLTFDDPVTGLNPGSPYYLVLSFLNATTLGSQSQVGWTMGQTPTGTNGAGEALAKGEVTESRWVNISSLVGDETYNYFQMSITAIPEPSSFVLLGLAWAVLLGYTRTQRTGIWRRQTVGLAWAILLTAAPIAARADTIHSNFGPSDSYDNSGGPNAGYYIGRDGTTVWEHAEFFEPDDDFVLESVEIAIGFVSGQNGVLVELAASDAAGKPGATIESFLLTNLDPYATGGSIQSATSVLKPTIASATRYWLVARNADPDSSLTRWHGNGIGDRGTVGIRENGGPWRTSGSGRRGAFRVGGVPIPEPAAIALFTLGLLSLTPQRRRPREKKDRRSKNPAVSTAASFGLATMFALANLNSANADTVFFDDFNDGDAADGTPVTWVPYNLPTFPGTFDASSGDYVLTPSDRAIVATVAEHVLDDVSIRSQVRILDPPNTGGGFELLARASTAAGTAYAGGLDDKGVLYLRRPGFSDPLARAETVLRLLDEDIILQLDVFGTSLSLWAWPAGEPMPAEPRLTATDASYAEGVVGIDYFSTEAVPPLGSGAFRYIHVADTHIANPGDYNDNDVVDAADYTVWRDGLGTLYSPADYDVWKANFGATYALVGAGSGVALPSVAPRSATVPEPAAIVLVLCGLCVLALLASRTGAQQIRLLTIGVVIVLVMGSATRAEIYRWDNGEVIPGTEGITPRPSVQLDDFQLEYAGLADYNLTGANFRYSNLTYADLKQANLTNADFYESTLTNSNLAGVDATNTYLGSATLTNANLTGAIVGGASFHNTIGFTKEQLYSTTSYRQRNLQGIGLSEKNVTSWDLSGQNLTNASFESSILTGTDLSGANLTDASLYGSTVTNANFTGAIANGADLYGTDITKEQFYSTDSYQKKNLHAIRLSGNDLSDWDLSGQNLSQAGFSSSTLTNTNLEGAIITRASFYTTTSRGLTKQKFYSTASYQQKDLQGIGLGNDDLSGWNFSGQDLRSSSFYSSMLTSANLAEANLANAYLPYSNVTGANFTGAIVTGANLRATGFTMAQLYATASYQTKNLQGTKLGCISNCRSNPKDLSGWDFSEQDLTNASLSYTTLTDTIFTEAVVTGADFNSTTSHGFTNEQLYSTASYQQKDLHGIGLSHNDLTGWNLRDQDLTNADFKFATVSNTDFTGAIVMGGDFTSATSFGLTKEQLYSTASYQQQNLRGIRLVGWTGGGTQANDLSGWDLSGQDLTNAFVNGATLTNTDFTGAIVAGANFSDTTLRGFTKEQFYSTASYQQKNLQAIGFTIFRIGIYARDDLSGWDFSGQDLRNANFGGSTLTDANLTAADLRGADINPAGTIARNVIRPEGAILNLNLAAGDKLWIRDDDSLFNRPPIPIVVYDHFAMSGGGMLRLVVEADPWDSLISFEPGIPVDLGGTLELTFTDDTNVASQVGRTLRIFDWTGVAPMGTFGIDSPYKWDLSHLYTTGSVTLIAVPEPTLIVFLVSALFVSGPFAIRTVAALDRGAGGLRRAWSG